MTSNTAGRKWRKSLAWSAAVRAAGLSVLGLILWLSLFAEDGPPWSALSLVSLQALAPLAGAAWYLLRSRAEARWRAALDRYAEQAQAKGTYPRRDSRRPVDAV